METLFLQIINMSISASWLIIAVILIRLLMQKAPKGFRYVLWALVGIRLLCPVFIESDLSLIPSQDVIADAGEAIKPILPIQPTVPEGNDAVANDTVPNDNGQNNIVQNQQSQNTTDSNDKVQNSTTQNNNVQNNSSNNTTTEPTTTITQTAVLSWVWLGGILALLMYAIVSYVQLRNTIKTAIQREDNLWICEGIQSPFILGLIHPQIYLPSYIEEQHFPYIVAHENEHIRCKDHWWKPLGFVLLTIHWFNPLVWVAYILMCRDIELACDERVIRTMGAEDKKNYSKSLLLCSNPRHFISACPVAFGEVGVKERIKKIVDYRKPSVWIIGIGILVCIIVAFGFMTNPKEEIKDVAKISLRGGSHHDVEVEITDKETIAYITENANNMTFVPVGLNIATGGWGYWLQWYDAEGNEIESMVVIGDNRISETPFFYMSITGKFDTDYYDKLIEEEYQRLAQLDPKLEMGELPKDKLEWFATEFFKNEGNKIANMFLTSEYSDAKDVNLRYLFYGGADGLGGADVSQEERQLLAQRYNVEMELDVAKTTKQEMDAVLQRYLGMSMEETNQVNLNSLCYLAEYDAYYNVAGDTMLSNYTFERGWINEDGSVILEYYDLLDSDKTLYRVTLNLEKGNYVFASNLKVSKEELENQVNDVKENLLSQELLDWFETEFFNMDENRMPNMFLFGEYDRPENIDLLHVFYGGADGIGGTGVPEEEQQILFQRYNITHRLDVSKAIVEQMNAVLKKYLGISLKDTNKVNLEYLYYLEEYDAYYNIAGDTHYSKCDILTGWENEDGTITLVYKDALSSEGTEYQVTLKQENGNYYFLSNIHRSEDQRVVAGQEVTVAKAESVKDRDGKIYTSLWEAKKGYVLRCSSQAAGLRVKILCKTSDEGKTYDRCWDISNMPNYPSGMYFFTEDIGYIITDYHSNRNFLYRTEDGGKTWQPQMVYVPVGWYRYINGLSIDNGVLKIEVVTDGKTYYYEYETDDMGNNWYVKK